MLKLYIGTLVIFLFLVVLFLLLGKNRSVLKFNYVWNICSVFFVLANTIILSELIIFLGVNFITALVTTICLFSFKTKKSIKVNDSEILLPNTSTPVGNCVAFGEDTDFTLQISGGQSEYNFTVKNGQIVSVKAKNMKTSKAY